MVVSQHLYDYLKPPEERGRWWGWNTDRNEWVCRAVIVTHAEPLSNQTDLSTPNGCHQRWICTGCGLSTHSLSVGDKSSLQESSHSLTRGGQSKSQAAQTNNRPCRQHASVNSTSVLNNIPDVDNRWLKQNHSWIWFVLCNFLSS